MNVKEKKVELIELFYDLIYVYAISRLTLLIEEPEGGIIPLSGFLRYIVVCFVILQAWLYLTNYVNRYGRWKLRGRLPKLLMPWINFRRLA
ncbi:low temperature requirement protein A [Baileyella intestinalis]|uniref:low temperature requirement protein A n=1 Tax=Baileyella intestinalis TaxID=2606709 RepID=UPI0022E2A291|nr:low temperature requirement protein A [Baileyella intestinalis]